MPLTRRRFLACVPPVGLGLAIGSAAASAGQGDASIEAFVALGRVVVGADADEAALAEYARWRIRHVPLDRQRFGALARAADDAARRARGRGFLECDAPARDALVAALVRAEEAPVSSLRREALVLYARSGAWLAIGYDDHPGRARGFAGYRSPPKRRA